MRIPVLSVLTLAVAASASTTMAQSPSVDYSSFLTNLNTYTGGTNLGVDQGIKTVFIPEASLAGSFDPSDEDRLFFVMRHGNNEIFRRKMSVQIHQNVFSRAGSAGSPMSMEMTTSGPHTASLEIGGETIAQIPFDVSYTDSGDPFNPAKSLNLSGPWSELACLVTETEKGNESHIQLRTWCNNNGNDATWTATISYKGEDIYVSREQFVGTSRTWEKIEFDMKFPESSGDDRVKVSDLTRQPGTYRATIRQGGEVRAVFPINVESGKVVPHPRSSFSHQPHHAFLCPREWNGSSRRTMDVFWLERDANPSTDVAVAVATEPTSDDLARWTVQPQTKPANATSITVTGAAVRFDAGIAAGDGIIAFGTGSNTGVAWMRIDDQKEQSLPDGQSYSSSLFGVAGRKLVLIRDRQVVVYDTDSQRLTEIPADQIHLQIQPRSMGEANGFQVNGNLVITANDPTKVADRKVIKIIDVSGAEPVVYGLKNADFKAREVNSVAVDAATGVVAVSSVPKKAMYIGYAVPGGTLKPLDLSGHDTVDRGPILIDNGRIAYRDDAGNGKLRIIDPKTMQIQTLATLGGGSGYKFAHDHGHYAMRLDRELVAGGRTLEMPAEVPGTGASMKHGNGNLGSGKTIAIAPGGTMLIAGDGKGGLGSGEFLMANINNAWHEFTSGDAAVPAADITMGHYFAAFKSGKYKDTRIAFVRFGTTVK